nr:helix-turn-helix domain-containing protein [Nocardioides perillae]
MLRAGGRLSTAATARMEAEVAWFRDLSAEDRSWVGLILQAGVRGFVDWFRAEGDDRAGGAGGVGEHAVAAEVFGAAPRALTGVINLQQTVDLVRLSIEVVEEHVDGVVDPRDAATVHAAVLRYAREVAFATAEVYARAAEIRGAWDARLEALVVDSVLRSEPDETVLSRASALGWSARGGVCVVLGPVPGSRPETDLFDDVRRTARAAGSDALCATQGDRLVVVLGGVGATAAEATAAAAVVSEQFGDGPVVVGPVTPDLSTAHLSARAAVSAHRAAAGWPEAPRPVHAADLLPERALAGDGHARRHLVEEVHAPLVAAGGALVETLGAYFHQGASVEGTARALFVHANTVRYRLRRVAEVTGLVPTDPRQGFTLRIALVLGRQSRRTTRPTPPTL